MLAEFCLLDAAKEKRLTNQEINLSEREKQVLALLAKGANNKEIADTLYISQNTVKVHLRNMMKKLHVRSRLQAAVLAREVGVGDRKGEEGSSH